MKYSLFIYVLILCIGGILGGCGGPKTTPLKGDETLFEEGQNAMDKKRYPQAQEKFKRLVSNYPGSSLVCDAQYRLGDSYFLVQDFVNAVFEYGRLVDAYPTCSWAPDARFKIAESYFLQRRSAELDQKETHDALIQYRRFIDDFPDSPLTVKARERIVESRSGLAEKLYGAGNLYQRQNHFVAARLTYQDVLRNYPDTIWYNWTQLRLAEIAVEEEKLDEARTYLEEILQESSDDKMLKEAGELLNELGPAAEE